jgi:hypothetical protein
MTDWIKHTTDTCPVDPDTVVEVQIRSVGGVPYPSTAGWVPWHTVDKYRLLTPEAAAKLTFAKPPEPEVTFKNPLFKDLEPLLEIERHQPPLPAQHLGDPFDDLSRLITLRLECLKLAGKAIHVSDPDDWTEFADTLLHYVLNGSVDKA